VVEVLEGEGKARSGITLEGNTDQSQLGGRRQGPRRKAQRTKVEPRSQTSSYVGL
jgi:hypothetical protein